MGATLAQLLVVALVCWVRLNGILLRLLVLVVLGGYLVLLGWSRIYLGMHHPSDVAWGVVNGVVCGLIAWRYLRTNPARDAGRTGVLAR
jgi:undecaprenyl-diphosphatase